MSTGPRYDPLNGTLVAPASVIRALGSGLPARGLLDELGAKQGGAVHERLAPTLAALRDPVHGTLQLAYKGRALDGWRGADNVALLTRVPAERLPAALARVAAVMPRPIAPGPDDDGARAGRERRRPCVRVGRPFSGQDVGWDWREVTAWVASAAPIERLGDGL